jgi:hypothetical protein
LQPTAAFAGAGAGTVASLVPHATVEVAVTSAETKSTEDPTCVIAISSEQTPAGA